MTTQRSRSISERLGNDYGWLAAQFILLGLTGLFGPLGLLLGWAPGLPWPRLLDIVTGLLLVAGGLIVAAQARNDLGDSLRVAPTPLDDAVLVESGWYGRVRHPLYLAVLLGVSGWALLWLNYLSLLSVFAVAAFLQLKSRHEERMLIAAYPGYGDYMRRVRSRFVPRVW